MKVIVAALALVSALQTAPYSGAAATLMAQEQRLETPNFDAYFPDDKEGGLALDRYHADRTRKKALGDDEYVALVRNGLRRTTTRKLFILREFGNRFVWGNRNQRPDAIELMFHAADPRPEADAYDTRHSAVYFGLSVTTDKTARILDALVAVAMASESASTISRVAWGTSDRQAEMLERLKPYLASEDAEVRGKAEDLGKIFRKEESAGERRRRLAIAKAHAEYAPEIPGIRQALREGSSTERRAALDRLWETSLIMIMDRSSFADFEAASKDADAGVRRDVVRIIGGEWIWRGAEQHDPSIDLMLRMSRDADAQVRYDSVYYGLSTIRNSRRDVVGRLLEMLNEPPNSDLYGRMRWGLRGHKELARQLLLETLESKTATHEDKVAAHGLYQSLLQEAPPVRVEGVMSPDDLLGEWKLALSVPGGRTGSAALVIERKGDGFLISSKDGMNLEPTRLLVSQHDDAVVAGAEIDGPDGKFVLTMTLSDGQLEGVFLQAHQRLLMPFSGARVTR